MGFRYPVVLVLIPALLWLLRRRRRRTALSVPSLRLWSERPGGRARFLGLPPLLRRFCLVLLIVAAARPHAGSSLEIEVTEGVAIQMLIDVSSSMDMSIDDETGGRSTRMQVAKLLVERFIAGDGDALGGRDNDLIGLITFARYADTRSPLTFGHEALLQIVRNLEIQERPNEDGTAYGDALAIAAARLKQPAELAHGAAADFDKIRSRVIILLTDGENNSGTHLPLEAAGLAKQWDCRIYTISLGDHNPQQEAIPGAALRTPAEQVLERIAVETGGLFRTAHDFESLNSVYREIDRLERSKIATRSIERTAELFWVPSLLGLGALLLALILEATWLRVVP